MPFYYNQSIRHKRPECQLNIVNPMEPIKIVEEVNAVADTGSEMTMIPDSVITSLGLSIESTVICRDANGNQRKRGTYIVNITLDGYKFDRLEVVAIPKNHALIGRDILNRYTASFNAAGNIWRLDCGGNCTLALS